MDTTNKKTYLIVLGAIILLAMAGVGILLWMHYGNISTSALPDPLADKMAPTDPRGCASGSSGDTDIPLGLAKTKAIVDAYLQKLNNSNLVLKEIIVYNNNSYARIAEKSRGINAMELFIDTETGIVISEYGTSMNWNLKYSSIPDSRSLGNIQLDLFGPSEGTTANPLSISPQQAMTNAEQYLKQFKINARLSNTVEAFYGYYVIEYLHWGKVLGMISINGYTGEAFRHSWHQKYIERMTY